MLFVTLSLSLSLSFVVWRTAPLHLDDYLRLICFLSTSVYSALGVSAIMRYINRRFTYLFTYLPNAALNRIWRALGRPYILDNDTATPVRWSKLRGAYGRTPYRASFLVKGFCKICVKQYERGIHSGYQNMPTRRELLIFFWMGRLGLRHVIYQARKFCLNSFAIFRVILITQARARAQTHTQTHGK